MKLFKNAYIHHPFVAIAIGFLLGMLVMWLMMKGIIPTGGIFKCATAAVK